LLFNATGDGWEWDSGGFLEPVKMPWRGDRDQDARPARPVQFVFRALGQELHAAASGCDTDSKRATAYWTWKETLSTVHWSVDVDGNVLLAGPGIASLMHAASDHAWRLSQGSKGSGGSACSNGVSPCLPGWAIAR